MIARKQQILRAAALVLVFVLGGLAALGTEWLRWRRAAWWTATAEVSFPAEWRRLAHGSPRAPAALTPRTAVEEALAAIHFGARAPRMGGGPGTGPGESAPGGWDRLADRLRAAVRRPDGHRLEISFHYSSPSADRAVSELNTVVGAYAARIQLAVASEVLRQAADLREVDDRVREQLGAIGPEFDRLVDYAVKLAGYPSDARKPDETPRSVLPGAGKENSPGATKAPAVPGAETDPRTTLEALRERREELLRDRTPAHPDVRYVEALIAEAETQLEEIPTPLPESAERPRREPLQPVVGVSVATSPAAMGPTAASGDAAPWGELFRAIQALQARVEALSQTVREARRREVPGGGLLLRAEDTMGIQWAERAEMIGAQAHPWALLWAAVAAGVVLAAGTAMVYAGVRIDSPIPSGDEQELERRMELPVLGYIEVTETTPVPPVSPAIKWKRPCIVAGAVAIAAYLAFLLQPLVI